MLVGYPCFMIGAFVFALGVPQDPWRRGIKTLRPHSKGHKNEIDRLLRLPSEARPDLAWSGDLHNPILKGNACLPYAGGAWSRLSEESKLSTCSGLRAHATGLQAIPKQWLRQPRN